MSNTLRWVGTLFVVLVSFIGYGQCAVSTFPYLEDFDGASWGVSSTFDPCWPKSPGTPAWTVDNNSTGSSATGPDADKTGGNYVYIETSSGTVGSYGYLETPYFDLSGLSNPVVSFYYHRYGATMGDMTIEASLDSGATWCEVYRISGQTHFASSDPWLLDSANLTAVKSSSTKLRFGAQKGSSWTGDNSIDSVAVYNSVSVVCPPVVCLNTTSVGSSTIDFDWVSGGTSFTYEVGTTGFTPGTGSWTATGSSLMLSAQGTGLTPATAYDIYVRNDCGGATGSSDWAGPLSVVTTCVPVTSYPYTENFDGGTWTPSTTYDPCWAFNSTSSFDWRVNSGTTTFSNTGPSSDASGAGQYVYVESSSSGGEPTAQLPEMDLTSLTSPELEFQYHMYGAQMGNLYIEASTDTGSTWTALDSIVGQQQSSKTEFWLPYIVDLTSVNSAYTLIRFRMVRGPGALGDASIDEVVVQQAPPCPTPTNFSVFNIATTTAQVTFDAQVGATRMVEWGPQGFTPSTGMIATSTTDTVDLTGLPSGTCLDIYIQTDCSANGNGLSAVSGPFTFCTPCTSSPLPYTENFDSWPLSCVDPAAGDQDWVSNAGWAEGRYWSFNNVDMIMDMRNVDVSVDARVKFTWSHSYSATYPEDALTIRARVLGTTVWDTLWSRVGPGLESNDGAGNTTPGSGVVEIIALDPATYTGNEVEFQIFGHSDFGPDVFVDDWVVEAVPTCVEPLGFTTITVDPDSVFFTFSADTAAIGYNIEWGPCGFGQGTGTTATLTNDSSGIGGLMAATCYELYIQTDCGSGQSVWSGPFQIVTACDTLPIPWNEGFETATIPDYPACWGNATTSPFYLSTVTGTSGSNPGPRSGSNYLLHRYSFNNEWWSFTPEFNLSAGQSYEISFWYQTEGTTAFDEVTLAFGSGQTPADMIYNITTETGVSSPGYTQFVATFIPVTSGIYHIGLMTRTTGFSGAMNIDDFQLQLDPNPCPDPSSLIATIVSPTEADLAWGGVAAHTTYDVEWGPTGFIVGTGVGYQYYGLTSATLNLDTLSDNTCYDFYVRADCGSGAGSWVGPYTWCTPCTSAPLPYSENFDVWPLNCVDPTAGDEDWVSNAGWAEGRYWSFNDVDMIMNMRNVDVTVDARVKFTWSHSYSATYPEDALTIRARVLGTATWDTLWSRVGPAFESNDGAGNTAPGTGANAIIALDPATYTGNVVEFQVYGHSDFGPDVFVDNWVVEAVPTCPEPFSVNTLPNSVTTNTGTIYFAPGGSTDFNVSYAVAGTITNPSAGTISNETNDTVVVSGLLPATTYEVWVRDSCGVGDVSPWTGPTTFTTLCVPFTTPYIQDFNAWPPVCWDVNQGGQPWVSNAGWAEASFWSFNNVTMVMESPQVILSDTSELSFKWSHLYSTAYPNDAMAVRVRSASSSVWDTLWYEVGPTFESNDGAGNTAPGAGAIEFIPIPGYGAGDTILVQFFATSGFGPDVFVDDVNIYDRPGCDAPANLTWISSATNSATITWDEGNVGNAGWSVEVGPPGFQPGGGTSYFFANDTATVPGLSASSNYCVYLTEICPGGADSSSTIGPLCFQTLCAPVGIPYSEDFTIAPLSQCFTNYNTAGDTDPETFWKMTNTNWMNYGATGVVDHTGNGGYAVGVDASTNYVDSVVLLTPRIITVGQPTLELSFWLHSNISANPGTGNDLHVAAWTTSGWQNIYTWNGDTTWMEVVLPLNGVTLADTTQFMFSVDKTVSGTFYNDMILDDILVDVASSCFAPSNVAIVDSSCTSVEVDWTSSNSSSIVQYGPSGFTPGTGTFANSAATYVIGGLTAGTAYDVWVGDTCNGDTLYTGPVTVTTPSGPLPTLSVTGAQDSVNVTTAYWSFNAGSANADSVHWDFGGVSQNGESVQQNFGVNGADTVTVTAYNDCGSVSVSYPFVVAGVSVEESLLAHSLTVYPNPTAGAVTVDFRLETDEEVTLSLINALGQRVVVEDLGKLRSYSGQLDLSSLPRGVYILQVNTGTSAVNQRITLQ